MKKLTSMPAEMYHLEGRGVLKAGMKADICLMDYENVKDRGDLRGSQTACDRCGGSVYQWSSGS